MLLDDPREEGLPGVLGQLAVRGVVRAGLVDGEGLDQQRDAHAPGDVGQGVVGKRARQLAGFGEVGQDLVERSRAARPGGVGERDHERAAGRATSRAIATACDQHSPAAAWSPR